MICRFGAWWVRRWILSRWRRRGTRSQTHIHLKYARVSYLCLDCDVISLGSERFAQGAAGGNAERSAASDLLPQCLPINHELLVKVKRRRKSGRGICCWAKSATPITTCMYVKKSVFYIVVYLYILLCTLLHYYIITIFLSIYYTY